MSVQFGRWIFDGQPLGPGFLDKVSALITPFGRDGSGSYVKDGINILYRGFHTTIESHCETQPYLSPSGTVVTWDGRLDNREDLVAALDRNMTAQADVSIVAAAYDRWGAECFAKLVGDWSAVIWNPSTRSLMLAKDFLGTKHLYYMMEEKQITWSTLLDPLVLTHRGSLALDEEYIAGWFSNFPAAYLTPFLGVHAVAPSSYILIKDQKINSTVHFDFAWQKKIRYRSDQEYEEHFRNAFRESVRRRLRSDRPILAELSGGLDSSSIVCTADQLIADGAARNARVDTLSYFDDSEVTWNERPFVRRVEEVRGRTGFHIDVAEHRSFPIAGRGDPFLATPGFAARLNGTSRALDRHLASCGTRVILSGLGGDEVLGGVSTPVPGLADLITGFHFLEFSRESVAWAKAQRKPLYKILGQTLRAFLPANQCGALGHASLLPWLERAFLLRQASALGGYWRRLRFFGSRPSFQSNVCAIEALRRQIACHIVPHPLYEKRFPYLDRDLWEFVCAIPREQILRPGERRSLMRRALRGIVPEEVLQRRRKAVVTRAPFSTISDNWRAVQKMTENMVSREVGIVTAPAFARALERARNGTEAAALPLLRTLLIELWLSNLRDQVGGQVSNFAGVGTPKTDDECIVRENAVTT